MRPSDIAAAARVLQQQGKETSGRKIVIEARDVFNEAVLSDWSFRNPADAVKNIRARVRRTRLSGEAWQMMLGRCPRKSLARRMLTLALVSAQRRADLSSMTFDQVAKGHLWIRQQKTARQIAIPLELSIPRFGLVLGEVIEECRKVAKGAPYMLPKRNGTALPPSRLSMEFVRIRKLVMNAGDLPPGRTLPTLHEVRSLAERTYRDLGIDTQTLLGHKFASTTNLYNDDRGLDDGKWKFVRLAGQSGVAETAVR